MIIIIMLSHTQLAPFLLIVVATGNYRLLRDTDTDGLAFVPIGLPDVGEVTPEYCSDSKYTYVI